jgi:hypothetical protein
MEMPGLRERARREIPFQPTTKKKDSQATQDAWRSLAKVEARPWSHAAAIGCNDWGGCGCHKAVGGK